MKNIVKQEIPNKPTYMKYNIITLFCLVILFSFGCISNPKDKSNPKKLVFAVIPSDDLTATVHSAENFSKFLEKKLGMKVDFYKAIDYTAVIEAMKAGKVQIARFGPFSYVLASKKAGAEAIVAVGEKEGVFHSYYSLILTNAKSKIKSMDDLKENVNKLSLSFVDPASASGHLIPRGYLTSIGLDPEKSFKQVVFSSSHAASLLTLITGRVDVAAANNFSLRRLVENGKVKYSDFNILWQSEPIIPDPTCVQKDISPALKQKIADAFIALPKEAPEIWKEYVRYEYKGDPAADNYIYIPSNDSLYNPIRKIFDQIDIEKYKAGK